MPWYRSDTRGTQLPGRPPRLHPCKGDATKLPAQVFPLGGSKARSPALPGLRLKLQVTEEKGERCRQAWEGGRNLGRGGG